MAKFLVPQSVGLYGLLAATIGYGVYAVGFEFYAITTRELIGSTPAQRLQILWNQVVFHSITYAVVLAILAAVFAMGILPWTYLPWLIGLLVLEHVGLELNRILVALSKPLLGGVLLFVRSGAWCLLVMLVMWRVPTLRSLNFVLSVWTFAGFLGCVFGFAHLANVVPMGKRPPINWQRIRASASAVLPLLVASLSVRGILTIDRYWIEHLAGLSVLGAYVLFMGMASAVLSFLDAAVIDFASPLVVAAVKAGDRERFRAQMRALSTQVLALTTGAVVICWLATRPLLVWLGKAEYLANLHFLPWLLIAVALYGFSMVPHVALYAQKRDRVLLMSHLAGFGIFVLVSGALAGQLGAIAVPRAICAGFGTMFCWKVLAYARLRGERKNARLI